MSIYFIGVDVGSGSARAGVFDALGHKLGAAERDILQFKPQANFIEQSSGNIWQSVCLGVREAVLQADIDPVEVKGIGFDATCSLVVLDKKGDPLTVSPTDRREQNIIMWMDHRAVSQADRINATRHPVLAYVGNMISPEMQIPKLLWLQQHKPDTWSRAAYFFDLPDFLTWKATNSCSRSLCSTVCKWTYLGHENQWDESFFVQLGLEKLIADDAKAIGNRILPIGTAVGRGLSDHAAKDLGLIAGTAVATSMIDAHAGGIGMLGAVSAASVNFDNRLALIGGTSSCHMAVSKAARFIEGIWGPYYGAMIPGYWLNEGGQSATGALIDHILTSHPYYERAERQARDEGHDVYQLLNERLSALAGGSEEIAFLTKDIHVLPYFHGNRSPRANASLTGSITGLKMTKTVDDLALQYLATIQAIALGSRHIIEVINQSGYAIDTIIACGGDTKNTLFVQEHANATNCKVLLPEEREAVLLGSAMLGAVAAELYPDIATAMGKMSRVGENIVPQTGKIKRFYEGKYKVFHKLYEDDREYKRLMEAC